MAIKKRELAVVPNADPTASQEIIRILRTKYLDELGFWTVDNLDGRPQLRFDRGHASRYVLAIVVWALAFAAMFAGFWWMIWYFSGGHVPPGIRLALTAMAWVGGIGVFLFCLVARSVQVMVHHARGPWVILDPFGQAIELPRQKMRVRGEKAEWTVLYTEDRVEGQMHGFAELMLTAFLEDGDRICISVTRRSGRKGLEEMDRMGRAAARGTRSKFTATGYAGIPV